jgi:hypothetical protein
MKTALLLFLMLAVCARGQMFAQRFGATTAAWTPASLNPAAWYKLDGNALDSSTYANHGELVNSPTNAADRTGMMGGALGFNSPRRIKIPDAAQIDVRANLTITFWMLPQSSTAGWLLSRNTNSAATTQYGFLVSTNADDTSFYLNGATRTRTTSPAHQWMHIVCVRDGGAITMYTNGAAAATATYTNALIPAPNINIGMRSSSVDNSTAIGGFVGCLDDVLIFNRALSPAEITQLYQWRP